MDKDKNTKKEKDKEIFEVGDKEITKESTSEIPVKSKNQEKDQEKLLKNILFSIALLIILVLGYYLYAQTQITMKYNDIEFRAASYGENIILYETLTLLPRNDGTKGDFGFRIRTKPSELRKVPFESEDLELLRMIAFNTEAGNFTCEGKGMIAIQNMMQTFPKMGIGYYTSNETCDPEGRYNLFTLNYGDKTQINKIGENCYEVIVEGNDESCEILPATEKIMVEFYSKYKDFVETN